MKKSDRERRTDAATCKMMPVGFEPGPYEILVGRGRRCTNHWGNQRFRAMIEAELTAYTAAADCKRQKSVIIGRVLADIKHHSPHAGFVKKDVGTGRWLSLTDAASRVTCAQAFRDALVDTYRSSKHSKQVKRRIEKKNSSSSHPQPRKRVQQELPLPQLAPKENTSKAEVQELGAAFLAQKEEVFHFFEDDEPCDTMPPLVGGGSMPIPLDPVREMPPLDVPMDVDMDIEDESLHHHHQDAFSLAAAAVADIYDEPSTNSELISNDEFEALFEVFAHDVDMEDNPYEPLPIVGTTAPAPLSSAPIRPIGGFHHVKSNGHSMMSKKRGNGTMVMMPSANATTPFGSTPFKDVRAAMSA